MTWNIFRIFGIFIMALVIYAAINKFTGGATQPVRRVGDRFMAAVKSNDIATLRELIDPSSCTLLEAGGRLASLSFSDVSVFQGSFAKQPAVKWGYSELIVLTMPNDMPPQMDGRSELAMLAFADGAKMYLRKVEGAWKIFYIAQATAAAQ